MKNKPAHKSEPEPTAAEFDKNPLFERSPASGKSTAEPLKLARLLVPLDFSDCSMRALDYALALAEQFGSKIILLHIVEPAAYPENYLVASPALDETNQNLLESARERLLAVSRKRIGHRLPAETLVRMGRAHSEIPDTAEALGADLIVLGTHGYTGLKHVLLGSTAERVVRHAPCPVLTVRHAGAEAAAEPR
jgi:nucleotide-binding universal stress UspA family protein